MSARRNKERLNTGRSNIPNSSTIPQPLSSRPPSSRSARLAPLHQPLSSSLSSARLQNSNNNYISTSRPGTSGGERLYSHRSRTNNNNNNNNHPSQDPFPSTQPQQPRPGTTPNSHRNTSARSQSMFDAPSLSSSLMNPHDFLSNMRTIKAAEAKASAQKEADRYSSYNRYSRPKASNALPLRSSFLDPAINNIPKSKTRTELLGKLKNSNIPHLSYDIDGDGYVSPEDLLLGKRFDLDGNGILDPEEQAVGRYMLAEEFFSNHRHDLELYNKDYLLNSEQDNIDNLANSHTFTKLINQLKGKELNIKNHGSANMTRCLTSWNPALTKNNFWNDKYNTSAWNDFGAEPRSKTFMVDGTHSGSRHAMFSLRKIVAREQCQVLLDKGEEGKQKFSTRRCALMTDVAIENS